LVTYWANGLLGAALLFVSVFLHELSHSIVALRYGIPVSGITLHIFGGVSQLTREPDRPGAEWNMAIVGPLTSLAIAGVLALFYRFASLPAPAAAVTRYLVATNTLVGVFNLLPGFPLDGGRVLRALLWKATGDRHRATRIAGQAGAGMALFLVIVGIVQTIGGNFVGGLWLLLIGLFLRQAAGGSSRQEQVREALGSLAVRDVMTRAVVQVPADLSVARLVEEVFWPHHVSSFPVIDRDRVIGIVTVDQLKRVPRERWEETCVRDLMHPIEESMRVAPGDALWAAFEKLAANGVGRVAVLDGGRLVGYLSIKDVTHVLAVPSPASGRGRPDKP
ncbi:MAG TPA: site-2 protease family protein, partial [Candidatus Methylomirabilis sp.]|nr:site-2 protease family protein [Candidatus Methylomirabilis sp.]